MSETNRGNAKEGDLVEWVRCDRRGVVKYQGVVIGESTRKFTHWKVRTDKGIREVNRSHVWVLKDQ